MPALGLGTWKAAPGEVGAAVETAIRLGYRHIDCAAIYGNESEVGDALERCQQQGLVSREDLWITSKLWNDHHGAVRRGLTDSLSKLRLDYLDLYLVHWPVPLRQGASFPLTPDDFLSSDEQPIAKTWADMEAMVDAGLTRHIGVSNFNIPKITSLLQTARIKPAANQIELHPYLQQQGLVDFCIRQNIHLTAYSPLGSMDRPETMKGDDEPVLLHDEVISAIAGELGWTPAQVLLAWAVARGTSVIPKSTNEGRLAENLKAGSLELSPSHMERIAQLDRQRRYVDGTFWAVPGGPHTADPLWNQ